MYDLSKLTPRRPSLVEHSAAIYVAARAVLDSLDEDEHVGADFFRQHSVHLRPTGHTVRFGRNRQVLDQRTIDHIDKTFTVAEVDRILDSLLSRFGSDSGFAVHVARCVHPEVKALSDAMEALHSLKK